MENTKKPPLKGLLICIAVILSFFAIITVINEYTIYFWKEMYLKTAPVDPRDLLRWDYVILRYEFEDNELIKNYISRNNIQDWTPLYVSFERDDESIGSVYSISKMKPKDGVYLKIKTDSQWWRWSLNTGIWKYFVPEWTGREIERIRWDMTVKIKVDSYGTAKIIDLYYKWEKIDPKTFVVE